MTPERLAEIRGIHARLTSPDHCVTTAQASAAVADLLNDLDNYKEPTP